MELAFSEKSKSSSQFYKYNSIKSQEGLVFEPGKKFGFAFSQNQDFNVSVADFEQEIEEEINKFNTMETMNNDFEEESKASHVFDSNKACFNDDLDFNYF